MEAPLKVLVTGVSGFVGGVLGRYLRLRHGHRVTGLSRRPARPEAVDAFVRHDLTQPLPQSLGSFDAVVHAAALTSPWARPAEFRRHNVEATGNVIDFVRATGTPHLVFVSSSSVFYRDGDQLGITETTPLPARPINTYAASKRAAESLVRAAALDAAILRPRAVFGAGDTVLFPRILRAARLGMLPRFTRPDGSRAIGDLISIDNLVAFVARVLDRRACGDYNLTDGRPVDIYDFLAQLLARLDLPAPRRTMPARLAMRLAGALESASKHLAGWREPPLTRFGVAMFSQSKTFDIAKAVATLGAPRVPTEVAVERFVRWQKEQP
jgi:nucleoside-diphosphate-sugar epimerase